MGGAGFVREVVDGFGADAERIVQHIAAAASAGDRAGLTASLTGLRRAAGQLGARPLCALLTELQHLPPGELRQQGAAYVERIAAEVDHLAAALSDVAPADAGRRR